MGAKVRGISQANANLRALVGDIQGKKVMRAIQSALLIGSAQAAIYTPIDTSTLINSQFREVTVNGTRVTGRVGYTANYAVYVHDPRIKQSFRRSSARKEFLSRGFEDERKEIDDAMRRELQI
ncbi:TPA: HK97 gp10 family phage protein [Proteus mirabilis]|uniref:HK97 gp10 family phage protein n=1 Tax=Proteus terrae TaxID=1574161 RepID=UPI0013740851|nr:HK97 gp10 family phage protein [Proteus terrae]QHP76058.1 HK97 gp10 family phage protein [Proteus vulgaris]HCZ8432342.1 HK97 gp10 family phage protein [Proteus mirabilis]QKD69710.1 HK97 gp10 family phage protein [Proteus terrae subsp. cibarius]HCZ8611381.1 HK97 gp10 family phage protein [Proteus mirabilis]HCZ8716845.1 HK97 gp10 family phage protein [Proteus mirabilis]